MADDTSPVYQAQYGWDRKTTGVVVLCAVFTVTLLVPGTPLFAQILGPSFFGGGGLFMAYMAMSRKVAFRVDETGVLLGGNPARYKATTVHVPWDDITDLVLWRQVTGTASVPHIGLVRREGAPALPGDGPKSRAVLKYLVSVPADVAIASRAVTGWRLDEDRLITAVAHFAPGIPVRDHR